jgi:lysophospholipase L1-like esterase
MRNDMGNRRTLWVIGDSTLSCFEDKYYYPRYGYGTMLKEFLDDTFDIENIALSGRSSKSFTTEPEYKTLLNGMKDGDFLIIGFGHNDEKTEKDRFTDANGDYIC